MMESAPFNYRRVVIWIGRIVMGGIFIFAGFSKLFYPNHYFLWPWPMLKVSVMMNLSNFGFQVESYKLLSPAGVDFVSHTLPFAEVILGALLLIGWRLHIWGTIVSLIMLGFLTVVTRAYLLHMEINCGCWAKYEPITLKKILEDSAMVLLTVAMTVFAFAEARKPHPWTAPTEARQA